MTIKFLSSDTCILADPFTLYGNSSYTDVDGFIVQTFLCRGGGTLCIWMRCRSCDKLSDELGMRMGWIISGTVLLGLLEVWASALSSFTSAGYSRNIVLLSENVWETQHVDPCCAKEVQIASHDILRGANMSRDLCLHNTACHVCSDSAVCPALSAVVKKKKKFTMLCSFFFKVNKLLFGSEKLKSIFLFIFWWIWLNDSWTNWKNWCELHRQQCRKWIGWGISWQPIQ